MGGNSAPKNSPVWWALANKDRVIPTTPFCAGVSDISVNSIVPSYSKVFPASTKRREIERIIGFSLRKGRDVII